MGFDGRCWVARFDLAARRVQIADASAKQLADWSGLGAIEQGEDRLSTDPTPDCWFGWIGYEAARWLSEGPEPLVGSQADELPELWLMRGSRVRELAPGDLSDEARKMNALTDAEGWYAKAYGEFIVGLGFDAASARSDRLDRTGYEQAVESIRAQILAGTIYQANLVRRVDLDDEIDPRELFLRLGRDAPVSHAALVSDGAGGAVVSHSPELLLRLRPDGRLETRPIKGTVRVGEPGAAARANAGGALLASEKDRAEHLMIVDLERNDLGRIAATGSVRVDELFGRLDLPHLVHLESTISAEPRAGLSPWDAVRALFPGGSITGAPKLMAMDVIRRLEPARRGVSMGAVGWIGSRSIQLNVAIRTLSRPAGGCWRYHVGGGIVADSDPASEWHETQTKERALREAVAALSSTSARA